MSVAAAPEQRRRLLRDGEASSDARYVLYWMTANRRLRSNFALQHAVHEAEALGLPLLIAEGLDVDHPWSSRRMHRAIIEGMVANGSEAAATTASYYPYVEHRSGEGQGWIAALSRQAAVVVVDDAPIMGWQGILQRLRSDIDARLVAVDSVGVLPMRQPGRVFKTAYSFRRHLHRHLPAALLQWPVDEPLVDAQVPPAADLVADDILSRWPRARLDDIDALLEGKSFRCVVPELPNRGGAHAARERLDAFASEGLTHYLESHRDPCGPAA